MKAVSKSNLNRFSAKIKAWVKARKIKASDLDSGSATAGQVYTADGSGGGSYQTPQAGTTVVANPTLAGTEAALAGLQVNATKYKVPSGTVYYTWVYLKQDNNIVEAYVISQTKLFAAATTNISDFLAKFDDGEYIYVGAGAFCKGTAGNILTRPLLRLVKSGGYLYAYFPAEATVGALENYLFSGPNSVYVEESLPLK